MVSKETDIDRLRRKRLEDDLSYRAMADAIGVSTMALYNVLIDKSQPTERTLYKISQYLRREQRA